MQNLKSGKEEIVYLLTSAIEKFKKETGQTIVQNTNRKNYESLAILLSEISNQLPEKYKEFGTEAYSPSLNQNALEYPYRKYDITGGQIKDALSGIVSNPRPFLVDACYIYLYGKGRKSFKENPDDENLYQSFAPDLKENSKGDENKNPESSFLLKDLDRMNKKKKKIIIFLSALIALLCLSMVVLYMKTKRSNDAWEVVKKNMNLLPYRPTQLEIDSLEGVWLCYTGSPQARVSDPARYHKVVANLMDIRYNDGYFTFNRYGASFNHIGYMQFESPGIVSVYSRIKNNTGITESPRHSLFNLYSGTNYLSVISSSWNFDIGDKNKIIGIREVYIKLGKEKRIEEIINTIENASCKCKIIRWQQKNNDVRSFYLKNELLDTLGINEIKPLIDEKSILMGIPKDNEIIIKDSLQ